MTAMLIGWPTALDSSPTNPCFNDDSHGVASIVNEMPVKSSLPILDD
jgi:hypothetical protein